MIGEVDGKIILNADKWYRVANRGDKPTKALLEQYLAIGGAVKEVPKKVAKKTTKKVAKKTIKKNAK